MKERKETIKKFGWSRSHSGGLGAQVFEAVIDGKDRVMEVVYDQIDTAAKINNIVEYMRANDVKIVIALFKGLNEDNIAIGIKQIMSNSEHQEVKGDQFVIWNDMPREE